MVLLVPDITNDFCADVAISLERALNEAGLSMVLGNTGENAGRQDSLLAAALGLRPNAIVLLGAIDTLKLHEAGRSRGRVVFVNRRPPPGIDAPFVRIDDIAAGRRVAELFLERSHADCVIIHGWRAHSASRRRRDGFIACFAEHGLDVPDVRQIACGLTVEAGYTHGHILLAATHPPRAVFCGNDMVAYGVHRAAVERGPRILQEVAICGFDDNRINDWLAPWLTTVRIPALEFGPAVVASLQDCATARGWQALLRFSLTLRGSV